jgi:ribosomal protein L17
VALKSYLLALGKDGRFRSDKQGVLPAEFSQLTPEQRQALVSLGILSAPPDKSLLLAAIAPEVMSKLNIALIKASDDKREVLVGGIIEQFYKQSGVSLTPDEKVEIAKAIMTWWAKEQETSTREKLLTVSDLVRWFEENSIATARPAQPTFSVDFAANEYEKLKQQMSSKFLGLANEAYVRGNETMIQTTDRLAKEYKELVDSLATLSKLAAKSTVDADLRAKVSQALYQELSQAIENFSEAPVATVLTQLSNTISQAEESNNPVSFAHDTFLMTLMFLELL